MGSSGVGQVPKLTRGRVLIRADGNIRNYASLELKAFMATFAKLLTIASFFNKFHNPMSII
jgi:hypothetical protein